MAVHRHGVRVLTHLHLASRCTLVTLPAAELSCLAVLGRATKVANIALVLAYRLYLSTVLDDKKDRVLNSHLKLSVQLLLEDPYAIHTNKL
jgi:hypothetical protein